MAELNKILLIGRLTKDPELRYIPSGMAVATLRMAVNHSYRTKEEKKQEVLYIDVNVWGKSAEAAKQYLTKGREVYIEGRLQQDEWTDKQNQKRISYKVNAERFQFLGSGSRQDGDRAPQNVTEDGGGMQGEAQETFDGGGEAPVRQDAPAQKEDDLPF